MYTGRTSSESVNIDPSDNCREKSGAGGPSSGGSGEPVVVVVASAPEPVVEVAPEAAAVVEVASVAGGEEEVPGDPSPPASGPVPQAASATAMATNHRVVRMNRQCTNGPLQVTAAATLFTMCSRIDCL